MSVWILVVLLLCIFGHTILAYVVDLCGSYAMVVWLYLHLFPALVVTHFVQLLWTMA